MSKWEYLDDEYEEAESFEPIRKTKTKDENLSEFTSSLTKKDNDRKLWARARKMKEFEEVASEVTET